ncbi:MAG: Fe-S protein assembly co-chaperone HscB [Polyangiaceae bacterium]|nr:Fe-S protein assembly co-chaperone HscB [Polyangiaceae bacterium]
MLDPFATLGLEPAFDLDLAEAERRHRDLSRALHPDRHAQSTPADRRAALGKAIEVNEAWRILKDPVRRGEALLRRLGVEVEEGREPKPDPALLMHVMEQREALAQAGRERNEARLEALVGEMRAEQARAIAALSLELGRAAANGGASVHAAALLSRLGELRYFQRFLDEATMLRDELF